MRPLSLSSSLPSKSNCDDDAAKWLKMDGSAGVELGLVGSGEGGRKRESREFRSAPMIFSPSVEFWFC